MPLRLLVVITITLCCMGCSWTGPVQPSVLVITVETLGYDAFSCNEEQAAAGTSGFEAFCEESVRFTHAYAPSTMSQASMASILTARYPRDHGVHHNGGDALSGTLETIAEVAHARDYTTSFFSAGPPIFRRSNIHQGFQTFDDNLPLSLKKIYRSAHETVGLFNAWLDSEARGGRFFSMIYLADGQFTDLPTANEFGELRESSYPSQIEEVDGALGQLVAHLKKRKIWDKTDVILVGLNGHGISDLHPDEPPAMNLYSESTHVALMIKPARERRRDGPFQWKIDSNVSLVDVGATLFDFFDAKVPAISPVRASLAPPLEVVSLRPSLQKPEATWGENRLILSESAWTAWRGIGGTRVAARQGPYFLIFDAKEKFFNTLTDGLETAASPIEDVHEKRALISSQLRDLGYSPWQISEPAMIERANIGRELWRGIEPDTELLNRLKTLSERFPTDTVLEGWRAIFALRHSDWKELEKISVRQAPHQTWAYVAGKNLDHAVAVPTDPCFTFLGETHSSTLPKGCDNEAVRQLVLWHDEMLPEADRQRAMDAFFKAYASRALTIRVSRQNYVAGLKWDTELSVLDQPEITELLLALPEFKRVRALVKARLSGDTTKL